MWETYLGWLKEFVLPPITEAAAAAAAAGIPFSIVTHIEETGLTGAVENVLPHLHHFFHPLSFARYFSNKFKGDNLYFLCYQACTSFSAVCEAALQEMKTKNKEAYWWLFSSSVGPKSYWAIAFSPNKHVNDFYWRVGMGLWDYDSIKEKWSIVEIVESSRERVANCFSERRREGEEAASTTTGLAPRVMEDIQWAKDRSDYKVESFYGLKYQIISKGYGYQEVVDLEAKRCTCGEFQAHEYPCRHALVIIAHSNLDVRNYFNHRWYSLDTYRATYAGILPPPIPDHILQWQTAITKIPPKRTGVGRPPKLQKISV